jgi:hypothetical protein
MKKHSNSSKESEPQTKRVKLGVAKEGDCLEVMSELVAKLAQQLDMKIVPAVDREKGRHDAVRPNLDRLILASRAFLQPGTTNGATL